MSLKAIIVYLLFAVSLFYWPWGLFQNRSTLQFSTQTIFQISPLEIGDTNINVGLYPSPFVGRFFHNKLVIYTQHFYSNFFALIDPNNYFFSSHPREQLPPNLNLAKFPFFSIIPFLYGIYLYVSRGGVRLVISALILAAILSLLQSPEPYDFALYPFVAYFIYVGLRGIFGYRHD